MGMMILPVRLFSLLVNEQRAETSHVDPQNWLVSPSIPCCTRETDLGFRSLVKKCWTVATIMLMTSSVYMGSSIWSPATMDGAMYFGVGEVTATLGLSLFVLGYGIGPLILAPITEIPSVGRTPPYIITLAIFCILQVPTALVKNFAGFAILRFLAGFVGSPPLATGGELDALYEIRRADSESQARRCKTSSLRRKLLTP